MPADSSVACDGPNSSSISMYHELSQCEALRMDSSSVWNSARLWKTQGAKPR